MVAGPYNQQGFKVGSTAGLATVVAAAARRPNVARDREYRRWTATGFDTIHDHCSDGSANAQDWTTS
jgi:hypothetical protein